MKKIGNGGMVEAFIWGGEEIVPTGPYGYVCLGLCYRLNIDKEILELSSLVLVRVDLKLRMCMEGARYEDWFRKPLEQIRKDGDRYVCQDPELGELPILNYKMLNIPETCPVEKVIDYDGKEKYRVAIKDAEGKPATLNRTYALSYPFGTAYEELYCMILGYDETSGEAKAMGFDFLGKIVDVSYCSMNIEELYEKMVETVWSYERYTQEEIERIGKLGFLNMDRTIDESGQIRYRYTPIWPDGDREGLI